MIAAQGTAHAADLDDETRTFARDLILVLADSKRLLGMRFANWILGAPELEAGIACASMAQDEWGHARLLYALLKDFGEDADGLEHTREPEHYHSMAALDSEPSSWTALIAINALADTALSTQLEAVADSAYLPLRQRVQKIMEEEAFHAAHGAAWFRRIAGAGEAGRLGMQQAVGQVAPGVLQWFGPDSTRSRALVDASIASATGSGMRMRFIDRVTPLIALIDADAAFAGVEPDFSAFDEASRRPAGAVPDARTIAQVRGDRNRVFLMD
ncbi:MAG: Phenylacetic acid catabolic protein [Gemmatimonadota bacterium]